MQERKSSNQSKPRQAHPSSHLLRENQQNRRDKGLFRPQELIALGTLVLLTLIFLAFTGGFRTLKQSVTNFTSHLQISSENLKSKYRKGSLVQLSDTVNKSSGGNNLTSYRGWIGKIADENQVETKDGKSIMTYTINFDNGQHIRGVKQSDLQAAPKPAFAKQATVQVSQTAETDLDGYALTDFRQEAAEITNVAYNYGQGGGYKYDIQMDDGSSISNVGQASLNDIYHVQLKESNSAAANNKILKAAFSYAKDHPGTILGLPKGNFTIGSKHPQSDYITLASDTQIRGNQTKLIVDGTQYWFGFATGPGAQDGVQNFTMKNITVQAKDLSKGNHFMVMTDHGSNWTIAGNTFTMVHQKGSHVFDLGGLQNSSFDGNTFEGYAPDLTNKDSVAAVGNDHDIYAEAIQFDTADDKGNWDGNLLQKIDPNYSSNNQTKAVTSNVSVINNSFIPYKNESGTTVAYSATLGQHSADVNNILVSGNTLTDSLVRHFHQDDNWLFKPIHFTPGSSTSVYGNTLN